MQRGQRLVEHAKPGKRDVERQEGGTCDAKGAASCGGGNKRLSFTILVLEVTRAKLLATSLPPFHRDNDGAGGRNDGGLAHSPSSEPTRMSDRRAGTHQTCMVYQTILCKELRNPPPGMDCDLCMVCTVIQRSLLPEGVQELHFPLRINDVVVNLAERKRRTEPAADDPSVSADCRTTVASYPYASSMRSWTCSRSRSTWLWSNSS
jgi:hypothetical protein